MKTNTFTTFADNRIFARLPRWSDQGRLVGINVSQNDERILIEPVWLEPILIVKEGAVLYIDIAWDLPIGTLILQARRPFIQFVKAEFPNEY